MRQLVTRILKVSKTGLVLTLMLGACAYVLYTCCRLKQSELEERQSELVHLQNEISMAEYQNAQLRAQVAHLSTDAGAEEVAREKLGLIRPGEVTYVVLGQESRPIKKQRPKSPEPVPQKSPLMRFMHWFFLG